jgi:hypothetical protein
MMIVPTATVQIRELRASASMRSRCSARNCQPCEVSQFYSNCECVTRNGRFTHVLALYKRKVRAYSHY